MGESTIFQDSRGNQFEYHTYGSENGYPVLYMHGSVPMPFSKKLADIVTKYNLYVIVILRPCYGLSSWIKYKNVFEYTLTLNEMISHFEFKRLDVLGLSAGAPYCYAIAAAYPDLVDTINICSGIPLVNNIEIYRMNPWIERFLFFLSRHIPAWIIGRYGVRAIEVQEKAKGWPDFDGESMNEVFQKYVHPNWMGIGQSTSLQYRDWGFATDAISKKVYIHHSRADEAIPFEIASKSAEILINSEFFVYELHSDNGSPMKAATFLATLEKLGVQSSFSRPRVSNDNPYSEALFKTMKYRPKYPFKGFSSLGEARKWVSKFVRWYNTDHLHSGIKFITPYQRHYNLDQAIMAKRTRTYELAREKHPERWSGGVRDWSLPEYVCLNPMNEAEVKNFINTKNDGSNEINLKQV